MDVASGPPDGNQLLQVSLCLDVVNYLLCYHYHLNLEDFTHWQSYVFEFGNSVATLFDLEICTKLQNLITHLSNHLTDLRFIMCRSS